MSADVSDEAYRFSLQPAAVKLFGPPPPPPGVFDLEDALDDAERDTGVTPDLGTAKSLQRRALRQRLLDLGYIRASSTKLSDDEDLKNAVLAFEGEAGLPITGTPSASVFHAVEQLVTLDERVPAAQLRAGRHTVLLMRAWKLRLRLLGFLPPGFEVTLKQHDGEADKALRAFIRAANQLSIGGGGLDPSTDRDIAVAIERLLDHPGMVADLATPSAFVRGLFPDRAVAAVGEAAQRLVAVVATNEFWLLGYDVQPGETAALTRAQAAFGARTGRKELTELFGKTTALRLGAGIGDDQLVELIDRDTTGFFARAWDALARTKTFVWDGLRLGARLLSNAWEFVVNLVQRGADVLKEGLAEGYVLLRQVFRRGAALLADVRRVLGRLADGITSLMQGSFSDADGVVSVSCDFDLVCAGNSTKCLARLTATVGVLSIGGDVLTLATSAVRGALAGPLGWLSFFRALLSQAADIAASAKRAGELWQEAEPTVPR